MVAAAHAPRESVPTSKNEFMTSYDLPRSERPGSLNSRLPGLKQTVAKQCLRLILSATLLSAGLLGCSGYRYRFPVSNEILQAPETEIHAVKLQKSGSGYIAHSITRLNGTKPMEGEPTALIASGTTEVWQWEVRAVPALLPSWKAWQNDKKVQLRAVNPDDWQHPAATWEQAFARVYKVVNYLLGKNPLPVKLTLLLIPDGTAYNKTLVQSGNGFVPLTFAFYYPSASTANTLTADQFSALVQAVSLTIHEYQHVMTDSGLLNTPGNNEIDKTINDENRSQCFFESALLALTSGTHTELKWEAGMAREALLAGSTSHQTALETEGAIDKPQRRYADATLWARYLYAKNMLAYLQTRGPGTERVLSNQPSGMNAVLSVCRAMTRQPIDLTVGIYPPIEIEYIPFFPAKLGPRESKP